MIIRESIKKKGSLILGSRLFSGGFWMLSGRLSTLVLGVVVGGLLARILSPEDMGTFILIESLVMTFATFAQLGLGHTSVRLIARSIANNNGTATKAAVLNVLQLGIIGAGGAAILLFILGPRLGIGNDVGLWASIWVVIFALQQLISDVFRGFHDFRNVVLLGGSKTGGIIATSTIAVILFVLWRSSSNLSLTYVFPFFLIGAVPALLFATKSLITKTRRLESSEPTSEKGQNVNISRMMILWLALPILVTTVTASLLNRSGIWVISAYRPDSEVAIFGVAARLVAIIALPMSFFETLISPTIVEMYTVGMVSKLEKLVRGITTILTSLALILLVLFVLWGSDILGLIYGDFYRVGSGVLTILVAGSVSGVVSGPCGITLVMTGHQKYLMLVDIITLMLSLMLMFALVGSFGVLGVAGAIALSTVVKNGMMLFLARRLTGIWTHPALDLSVFTELDWLQ